MPIQVSKRGEQVTPAQFENPFESQFTRLGVKGLNITDAIDAVEPDELTRMVNVTHRQDFGVTSRSGQSQYTNTIGTNHHSIRRLNDPLNSTYTRIHGIDTSLAFGQSTLNAIGSGYSGSPLTLVPYRPPFSSETYMFVADTAKMSKVSPGGTVLPIGLPAPTVVASSALATENKTVICACDSSDGTQASAWTGTPGVTYDNPPVPITGTEILDVTDDTNAPALNFGALETTPSASGFYAFFGCPKTMDLSKVGSVDAQDDDYVHIQIYFTHPQFIKAFRVYLVCSSTFSPTVLPGLSGQGSVNGDAYLKEFSSDDFSAYFQAQQIQTNAAELARITTLRNEQLINSSAEISALRKKYLASPGLYGAAARAAVNRFLATHQQDKSITLPANPGADTWQPLGVVSLPLRRGDFQRIGNTTGRDWSNITGIVTYISTGPSAQGGAVGTVACRFSQFYLTGGSGPDSGDAADSPYDYRYTHYDSRTGAEGNPSPEMDAEHSLDSLRRTITVTPTAYGDAAIRQRFYRRGGTLPTDWFFLGTNTSDGATFGDTVTDLDAAASGSVEDDNDQPVSTVNSSGVTVLNQPLSSLWGPAQDLLFGCGDPYRPGNVYFCKPGEPDSWPPDNRTEVCSPSEQMMTGCLYGGVVYAASKERFYTLYVNNGSELGVTVSSSPTSCTRGVINRWGLVAGVGGMYFVANDGIYRTAGGPEEWISKKIDPLFNGKSVNGMEPIDLTSLEDIRLEIFENELYFTYQDHDGDIQTLVYSFPYQFWRQYTFGVPPSVLYADEGNDNPVLIIGGKTSGESYEFTGTSDDGANIACSFRTGAINFGSPRLEKRFGDQFLDVDTDGATVHVTNYLNYEAITNPTQDITAAAGRNRFVFDDFGTTPQRGANLSTEIDWSSATLAPTVYQLGTTVINEPDITVKRVTQWDDLGNGDQFYITSVTFDCDTGGSDRTIIIERDYQGAISTVATLTVNADGRHKKTYSWPGLVCDKIRVRPDDEDCLQWQLFKADWSFQSQPPAISKWDCYFENAWDQYYTGLDLYCDTFGQNKTIECYVDGSLVKTDTFANFGRLVHHITIPWGRGHVFHFISTDDNIGTLYDYRWQLQEEPSEQTNWNQNFTTQSALYDKWLKAVVFECDTFNTDKTVTVECDGVVVETLTINANGRKVVQKSFPQHLGRVFRVYPTDDYPSRLYSVQFVFDGEPFKLDRWETQETTLGIDGWSYCTYGHITVKSTAAVNLSITTYNQLGVATTKDYELESTGDTKVKLFVPFEAMKGILHKFILTSDEPFFLYQEETTVYVRQWGTDATATVHPFGDADLDPTRNMVNAQLAAARPGGQA